MLTLAKQVVPPRVLRRHIFREMSKPKDWLVSLATTKGVCKRWFNEFPAKLPKICSVDVSAFVFERH